MKIAIKLKSLTTYHSTYMYFCLFLLLVSKFKNNTKNILYPRFDRSYYNSFLLLVYFLTVCTGEKGKKLIRMPKELGFTVCRKYFSYIICSISVGSCEIEVLNLICLAYFHLDSLQIHCLQLAEYRVGNQSLH